MPSEPQPLREVTDWLAPYAAAWDDRLARLQRHLEETDRLTDTTALAAIERTLELAAAPAEGLASDRRSGGGSHAGSRTGPSGTSSPVGKAPSTGREYGSYPVQIVSVDEPRYLAWRWGNQADVGIDAAEETTLVEWWLDERPDGGTTLRLRESGFTTQVHRDGNDDGWTEELGELEELLS